MLRDPGDQRTDNGVNHEDREESVRRTVSEGARISARRGLLSHSRIIGDTRRKLGHCQSIMAGEMHHC